MTLAKEVRAGWMELERESKAPRNTLTATNILAELLHTMGRNEEAEPLVRDVLAGFLRAVGPQHPFAVSAAENLANVLRALNKSDEADKVMKQFGLKTPLQGVSEEGGEETNGSAPKPKPSPKKKRTPKADTGPPPKQEPPKETPKEAPKGKQIIIEEMMGVD